MFKVAAIQLHSYPGKTESNEQRAIAKARQAAEQGAKLIVCLPCKALSLSSFHRFGALVPNIAGISNYRLEHSTTRYSF